MVHMVNIVKLQKLFEARTMKWKLIIRVHTVHMPENQLDYKRKVST